MTEAIFLAKIMKSVHLPTGAYECKITKSGSLPFSCLAPHQLHALLQAKHGNLKYKISDTGKAKKPFDFFVLEKTDAHIVAIYWKPKVRHFYLINVDIWFNEMRTSKRKSLVEARAEEIGKKVYL